jgi:hypothetical protein
MKDGQYVNVDMLTDTSVHIRSGSIREYYIYANSKPLSADTSVVLFSLKAKWNLCSIPLILKDYSKSHIFPGAATGAYAYNEGYVSHEILKRGVGYWIKFPSIQYDTLFGTISFRDTIDVSAGWNLIGSSSSNTAVSSIISDPPGIATSEFYGYDGGYYPASLLVPGKGYWVKANQAGRFILSPYSLAKATGCINIIPGSEQPPPPPVENGAVSEKLPREFTMDQNYPNPFNPTTVLQYALPSDSYVRVTIYNTLGQMIAGLVDEIQNAGYKEVTWNAQSSASGIYFYRVDATSLSDPSKHFSQTRKMVLIK